VRLYLFTCIRPVMIDEALVNVNANWMSFKRSFRQLASRTHRNHCLILDGKVLNGCITGEYL
ncbi:hypothetical protein, partial [Enterobacter cloacae complex sp. S4]|uniref:hypothetical protein n=1 Tax=Enterobacter cloacae complex sp. S4 TaxID=2779536 RepID=UPI001D038345